MGETHTNNTNIHVSVTSVMWKMQLFRSPFSEKTENEKPENEKSKNEKNENAKTIIESVKPSNALLAKAGS